MRDPEDILKLVCRFLNESGAEYAIVGGFAVMYHGRPRATADIDFIMSMTPTDVDPFVAFLLGNGFFASAEDMRSAFEEGAHCTVEDRETLFRLDIRNASGEMDMRVLAHRVRVMFDDVPLFLASAEDTIINKLLFGREMDIHDALSIWVRRAGKLDTGYIVQNCDRLGCRDALERLKRSSETGGDGP